METEKSEKRQVKVLYVLCSKLLFTCLGEFDTGRNEEATRYLSPEEEKGGKH